MHGHLRSKNICACGCLDLVAAEAIYHANCYSRCLLNKGNSLSTECAPGRPKDTSMMHWFQMLCQWLESEADAELYTLAELHDKMIEFSGGSDVYTPKQKLHEYYEDFIFFAVVEGHGNVLCFRSMASYIINDKWHSEKRETYMNWLRYYVCNFWAWKSKSSKENPSI